MGKESLNRSDALVHDFTYAPAPERFELAERNASEVLGDLQLETVFGIECSRVGTKQGGEVDADVAHHARDGHPAESHDARRVKRRKVRIDGDDIGDHEVYRDEWYERANR